MWVPLSSTTFFAHAAKSSFVTSTCAHASSVISAFLSFSSLSLQCFSSDVAELLVHVLSLRLRGYFCEGRPPLHAAPSYCRPCQHPLL
jgi:hypothetical protein